MVGRNSVEVCVAIKINTARKMRSWMDTDDGGERTSESSIGTVELSGEPSIPGFWCGERAKATIRNRRFLSRNHALLLEQNPISQPKPTSQAKLELPA